MSGGDGGSDEITFSPLQKAQAHETPPKKEQGMHATHIMSIPKDLT